MIKEIGKLNKELEALSKKLNEAKDLIRKVEFCANETRRYANSAKEEPLTEVELKMLWDDYTLDDVIDFVCDSLSVKKEFITKKGRGNTRKSQARRVLSCLFVDHLVLVSRTGNAKWIDMENFGEMIGIDRASMHQSHQKKYLLDGDYLDTYEKGMKLLSKTMKK